MQQGNEAWHIRRMDVVDPPLPVYGHEVEAYRNCGGSDHKPNIGSSAVLAAGDDRDIKIRKSR